MTDVRRLKIQQLLQLYTCESDSDQTIKWIDELQETLVKNYDRVGCNDDELDMFKKDAVKLEETARVC